MSEIPERWKHVYGNHVAGRGLDECIEQLGAAEAKVAEQAATIARLRKEIDDNEAEWSAAHDIHAGYAADQNKLAELEQERDVATAKLHNMAIECGQAEGLLERKREEVNELQADLAAARETVERLREALERICDQQFQ